MKEIEYTRKTGFLVVEGRSSSYANVFKHMKIVYGERMLPTETQFKEDVYTKYINYNRTLHDLVKELSNKNYDQERVNKITQKLIKIYIGNALEKHIISKETDFLKIMLEELPELSEFYKKSFLNPTSSRAAIAKLILKTTNDLKYKIMEQLKKELSKDSLTKPRDLGNKITVVFINGVNTAGKSTVARKLAGKLNYNLIHLDSIKYPLKKTSKLFKINTIEAYQEFPFLDKLHTSIETKSLYGYKIISRILIEELSNTLNEYVEKGKSTVVEGVHLDPQSLEKLEKEYTKKGVNVVKIMLEVNTKNSALNLKVLKNENDNRRDFTEFRQKLSKRNPANIWNIYKHLKIEGGQLGWIVLNNEHGKLDYTLDKIQEIIVNGSK